MQTTMNAAVLQKIVEFCYTNEVCLESSLQTFSLLKYATEYGITELVEKCRTFLNSTIAAAPPSAKPLPTDSIGKYQKNLNSTIVAASPIRKPLRTDSIEKCQTYLNSTISAAPQSPQPLATQQNLIIFGDLDEQTCFSAEMLVSMDAKWKELAELNGWQKFARRLTSVAYRGDDCVVVSGGLDILKSKQVSRAWCASFGRSVNLIHSQLVHLVDLKLGKIAALPPMKTARCEHASIVHNNFLYVAGGMKQGEHLDSVEKYSPFSSIRRVSFKQYFVVFFNFRLELKRRRWTSVPPMGNKRTLFSMVVADGLIYAIGGENELECTKLVEYYDPDKKVWMNTAPMIKPRASAGVAVLNNAIYAVGGSTVFKYGDTDTVERFDLDSKQWSLVRLRTKI